MTENSAHPIEDVKAPASWSDDVPSVSPESLIDAGFHFGHRTSHWNPRMKPYIRDKRNGIHIIDLKESLRGIITARHFLRNLCSAGGDILFVGCKRQAREIVKKQARDIGQAFMCERWLGGTLTNFQTLRLRLSRLAELEKLEESGKFARLPKKEQSVLGREKKKIDTNLGGLRNLRRLPAALVVVDANAEAIAILEARKLEIPVIAIVDTNSNPEGVDIIIPGNDDSVRGLQIVLKSLADACVEGKKLKNSGQGMEAKFNIRAFDEAPAQRQEKGRGRRPKGGGTRTRHGGKSVQGRADHSASVNKSADEAVKQAESQKKEDKAPTVRKKPAPKKDTPKADAPKSEAPKTEA